MTGPRRLADAGFHAGELAVQTDAGVRQEAARLAPMLQPARLSAGMAGFLTERTWLVITGRDRTGRLWTSPLVGGQGLLDGSSGTDLVVHAGVPAGDPLHGLAAGQSIGTTSIEFATRRRVRINGTLTAAGTGGLRIAVEQAYGNCPQYIHPRRLTATGTPQVPRVRHGTALLPQDVAMIRAADTFFLGTAHPQRGADASHRGGPPGFVRVAAAGDSAVGVSVAGELWWPDYPGNNLFNSLGNLAVDPQAALLFVDFTTGATLHVSGTARLDRGEPGRPGDDGHTGRLVRFTVERVAAGLQVPARELRLGEPAGP